MQECRKEKYRVGILGSTGYTGIELIRILTVHPFIEISGVTSQQFAGRILSEVVPSLRGDVELFCEKLSEEFLNKEFDIIYSCLPHGHSMEFVPSIIKKGIRVIDLSADYRFKDVALYEKWYKKHTSPELLNIAVYGLPEIFRDKIKDAILVSIPGCYPTGSILALAPAVKNDLIFPDDIIIDAKSGVTGGGRAVTLEMLYAEVNDGMRPYKVGSHRHMPEMEEVLSHIAERDIKVLFCPHLIPMSRGIICTIYCRLKKKFSADELEALYKGFYADSPFIRILPSGTMPATQHIKGSNYCDISIFAEEHSNRLIIISAIDNLGKGASGQAVQCMNIMLGLPERTALTTPPLFP